MVTEFRKTTKFSAKLLSTSKAFAQYNSLAGIHYLSKTTQRLNCMRFIESQFQQAILLMALSFAPTIGWLAIGSPAHGQEKSSAVEANAVQTDFVQSNANKEMPVDGVSSDAIEHEQEPNEPAAPSELVARLRSDRFSIRQKAMFDILESSASTIPLLVNEIETGDADFRVRTLKILEHFALHNPTRSEEAFEAIRQMSVCDDLQLSRKAQLCSFQILLYRQHIAARRLERLNAKVVYAKPPEGAAYAMADSLTIDSTWGGDRQDLNDIGELFGLSSITLNHAQVDDELASTLLGAFTLKNVKFKKCSISDDAIKLLSQSNSVSKLEIFYCNVGPGAFGHFKSFRQLETLALIGTQVDPNFSELLEQSLNAKIDIRNGAFLGIRYSPMVTECELTWVVENSGAEKAGFRVGDVIVEYDSVKIAEHTDLTKVLRNQKASASAKVKVLRGGKEVILNVVMGEWD